MKGYDFYDGQARLSSGEEDSIVLEHLSLVHKTAAHIKARLPDYIELEELVQIGMLGLLEATQKFDPSQGTALSTFASKRIRGAIIDEIRKRSPLSRTDSSYLDSQTKASRKLANELGRAPTAAEVATEMNTSLAEYERLRAKTQAQLVTSSDNGIDQVNDGFIEKYGPENALLDSESMDWLTEQIATLRGREQLILSLYYTDEMNLKEIGAILDISESRVSQILTKTVNTLRSKIV